jgi:hypothetical protein
MQLQRFVSGLSAAVLADEGQESRHYISAIHRLRH